MFKCVEMDNIAENFDKQTAGPNPDLVCCRACLAVDGKMYNIHEYNLVDAFTRVSGMTVSLDQLPQHLCSCCMALLRRCAAFKAKCERARLCLLPELVERELTMDYIRSIDRHANRLTDLTIVKDSITCMEVEPTDIKDITPEQRNAILDDDDDDIKYSYNLIIDEDRYKLEIESNEMKGTEKEAMKIENDFDDNFDVVENDIPYKPAKRIGRPKKRRTELKPVKAKKERRNRNPKRQYRSEKTDNLPKVDFDQFEIECGVKILILSKEEQLQEINARKASPKDTQYRCEHCGKGYQMQAAFDNHLLKHSPATGKFPCDICSVRFRQNCLRLRHQDTHRFKIVCQECGFVSRTRCQARNHHNMHEGKTFQCQHCGKSFDKMSSYLGHVRLAHPTEHVACDMCGETFIGRTGLVQHKARMHSVNMKQELKCPTCAATFISLAALNRHTDTAGVHAGLHSCPQCGEGCGDEAQLRTHQAERHPWCGECSQMFLDAASFATHYQRKHLGVRAPNPNAQAQRARAGRNRSQGTVLAKAVCDVCGKLFPSESLLRYHKRVHDGVRPYACPECPKTFCLSAQRKLHMRTHTGEKPFQCGECSFTFSLKRNMQRHILNKHLGINDRTPCDICGRFLATPYTMRLHVRTVHGGEPWPKRNRPRQKAKPQY